MGFVILMTAFSSTTEIKCLTISSTGEGRMEEWGYERGVEWFMGEGGRIGEQECGERGGGLYSSRSSGIGVGAVDLFIDTTLER